MWVGARSSTGSRPRLQNVAALPARSAAHKRCRRARAPENLFVCSRIHGLAPEAMGMPPACAGCGIALAIVPDVERQRIDEVLDPAAAGFATRFGPTLNTER